MQNSAIYLSFLVLFGFIASGSAAAASGPDELVRTIGDRLLGEIDERRKELATNPDELRKLVDSILLPHFDRQYAGRLVLGRNWRTATPQQRERFIEVFYASLFRAYASGLMESFVDRFTVLPYRGEPDATRAIVRTEVLLENGTKVPISYRLVQSETGWKMYDVIVEGVSYVLTFRKTVDAQLRTSALDELMDRLEKGREEAASSE